VHTPFLAMMSFIAYKFKHIISALLSANIGQLKSPLSMLDKSDNRMFNRSIPYQHMIS
jgi:hypothetical protein